MPATADVAGKPKANNAYAQKIVAKQAVRVSEFASSSPTKQHINNLLHVRRHLNK